MKRIALRIKHRPQDEPQNWKVVFDSGDVLDLDSGKWIGKMTVTRQSDGSFKNENGAEYVEVKPDRRPKPFKLIGQEEGRGPGFIRKFATLAELQDHVKKLWQGPDYIDGSDGFHTDYVSYRLEGTTLADLGKRSGNDYYSWEWNCQECMKLEKRVICTRCAALSSQQEEHDYLAQQGM